MSDIKRGQLQQQTMHLVRPDSTRSLVYLVEKPPQRIEEASSHHKYYLFTSQPGPLFSDDVNQDYTPRDSLILGSDASSARTLQAVLGNRERESRGVPDGIPTSILVLTLSLVPWHLRFFGTMRWTRRTARPGLFVRIHAKRHRFPGRHGDGIAMGTVWYDCQRRGAALLGKTSRVLVVCYVENEAGDFLHLSGMEKDLQ